MEEAFLTSPAAVGKNVKRRKHKHGSLLDVASRSHLPPGPESLEQLFDFPGDLVDAVFADVSRADRCRRLLMHGVVEHSDYSGICAERESKRLLFQVLREQKRLDVAHVFTKSCDSDAQCQKVLLHMSAVLDGGASCVFTDIRQQVVEDAQNWCTAMTPGQEDDGLYAREQVEGRYKEIQEYLLSNSSWVVDQDLSSPESCCPCSPFPLWCSCALPCPALQDHKSHCLVHNKPCVVNKPRDALPLPGALVIANAGNCCQGWSQEGKRARGAHHSQLALATWVCQRHALAQTQQEDMFFQECTPLFDADTFLVNPLKETHHCVRVVAGPKLLGWPTARDRLLSAGLSLKSLQWVGPETQEGIQEEFDLMFARCPRLNGSVFLQEGVAVREQWARDQVRKKKICSQRSCLRERS